MTNGLVAGVPGSRMGKRLSYSLRAVADLDEIWDYTEQYWGREQAFDYTSEMHRLCQAMAEGTALFQTVTIGDIAFWRGACGRHRIFAVDGGESLLVVRILHVSQDVERRLGD